MSDLLESIESLSEANSAFQKMHQKELGTLRDENAELKSRVESLEAHGDRPRGTGSPDSLRSARADREYKEFAGFVRGETKEMSIGVTADGGALVPEFIAADIISRAIARSKLASICRNSTSETSDYVRLLNMRGQTAAWSTETGTRNNTTNFQIREVRPTHGELYSVVPVTNWLLQDSKFDVASMILANAVDQFSKSIESAIYNGDGSSKPTGIVTTAPVTTADSASPERVAGAIQKVVTAGDVAADIITLFFSLAPEYRANSHFLMSSATLAVVRKLRDTAGSGFLWQQNLGQAIDAPDGLLLGRPVVTSEYLPTIGGSPQARGIFCGDFDVGYELVTLGGMQVIRDNVTVKGKTLFYISQRIGGKLIDNNGIKVLQA